MILLADAELRTRRNPWSQAFPTDGNVHRNPRVIPHPCPQPQGRASPQGNAVDLSVDLGGIIGGTGERDNPSGRHSAAIRTPSRFGDLRSHDARLRVCFPEGTFPEGNW
jgi:hypothetical protein